MHDDTKTFEWVTSTESVSYKNLVEHWLQMHSKLVNHLWRLSEFMHVTNIWGNQGSDPLISQNEVSIETGAFSLAKWGKAEQ